MENDTKNPIDVKYRIAVWTAGVAGVLAIVACSLLAYDYSRRTARDPLEMAAYAALRNSLAQQPANESVKEQIRAIDLELRREYFRQKAFADAGAMFLLVCIGVFLLAGNAAVTLHRRLPQPQPLVTLKDNEASWTRHARWAVAGLATCITVVVLILKITSPSPLPSNVDDLTAMTGKSNATVAEKSNPQPLSQKEKRVNPKPDFPSEEEIAQAWANFRGPGGRGISAFTNIPTEWNATAGKEKNLRWKTAVPLPGNNSPVVWKDRVFLSGADEKQREVFCFDAHSGELLWRKAVPATPQSNAKFSRPPDSGYAAPTVATDGRRVFAIFANGDLAGFDFKGNLAWSKSLGMPESQYGYASSLAMHQDRLIALFDQGSEKESKSKLYAFDSATGDKVWQVDRKVPNSWASPVVIRAAERDQIVTAANPWVISYDPQDGQEIWRAKCLRGDVAASPAFAAGKIYTANDGDILSAIPADGQGDVTAKILWKGEDGIPDTCSPLANEQFVLLLTSFGTLTCYDAEKGGMLWEESFDEECNSSPCFMGNRVFVFAKTGKAWVVEPGKEKCERIAENDLGEECVTTPAFQDGCFYIRGKDHLFCIGAK